MEICSLAFKIVLNLVPVCILETIVAISIALVSFDKAAFFDSGLSPVVVSVLVGLLSLSFAVSSCARAGLYCNHQDLSPRFSSALLGVSNTAGAIPGILGVWSAGVLLDLTGSWSTALFYPIAATQVFGLLVYTLLGSSEKQSWS